MANTLGVRIQGSYVSGFGGRDAPPFERFFMGGESDLRGFDVRTVSPYVFVSSVQNITLQNPDGTPYRWTRPTAPWCGSPFPAPDQCYLSGR